jgi:hypothetical protein
VVSGIHSEGVYSTHVAVVLIVRICSTLRVGGGMPEGIGFALGECSHGSQAIDIMDADFFDEALLVIAFRSQADGMILR